MQQDQDHQDEGFSLLEVVVSMVIFALLSSAVAGLLIKTLQTTAQGSQREIATNLADSEKEYQLGLPWGDVTSRTRAVTTNGAVYTVSTTVAFVPDSGGNTCSVNNGASLSSKGINVTVTWPGMGSVTPVRTDTVRPIPMAESGNTLGAIAWQINDSAGAGLPGIAATLTNSAGGTVASTVSDSNGCVLFSNLAGGNYGITVAQAGYVSKYNRPAISTSADVTEGKLSVAAPESYSPYATSLVTLTPPTPQNAVPDGLGVVLSPVDGLGVPQVRPSCGSGQTATVDACMDPTGRASQVYPKAYTAYAGLCTDPAAATAGAGVSVTPVVTGSVPQTTIALGAANLVVNPGLAGSLLGSGPVSVSAIHGSTTSCSSQTVALATAVTPSSTKVLRYALPVGSWTIRVTNTAGATRDTSISVTKTGSSPFQVAAP